MATEVEIRKFRETKLKYYMDMVENDKSLGFVFETAICPNCKRKMQKINMVTLASGTYMCRECFNRIQNELREIRKQERRIK